MSEDRQLPGYTRLPRWAPPVAADGPATGATPPPPAARHRVAVPPGLVAALERTARALGAGRSELLLAVSARVLATVTGEQDLRTVFVAARGSRVPAELTLGVAPASWARLVAAAARAAAGARPLPAPQAAGAEAVLDLSGLAGTGRPEVPVPGAVLRVRWEREGEALALVLDHDPALLDADHAARLGGYHLRALRLLAEGPAQRHDRQSLLSAAETETQLYGLAGPRTELSELTLVDHFQRQAARRPDAVAAWHHEDSLTYRALDERANRIAHALLATGAGAEDVVAVVMERGLDWIAAALGVLKAGCVYLPLAQGLPVDRIAAQLDASVCAVALTEPGTEHLARAASAELDAPPALLSVPEIHAAGGPVHPPASAPAAGQAAYLYFTSGSTGVPKGALCEHAGLLNHLHAKSEDLGLGAGPGEVVAQTAAAGFDISLWQFAAPLLTGAATRVIDTEVLLDIDEFRAELLRGAVTVLQTVPAYFEVLLGHLERHPGPPGALRVVSVTGETLSAGAAARWFALYPDIPLVNAYGATEVCDDTMHEILTGPPARPFVPLGRPLRNVNTYVLDENLELVPLGSVGEIAFSGVCVGRGYLSDEERTRQVFVPDPFRAGTRMYRTGDFGRWLPEGRIEFLGRHDEQVKIRGYRVELGEIESVLLAMPGVRSAAVVIEGDSGERRRLVAFLTASDGAEPPDSPDSPDGAVAMTGVRAREALAALLPAHLVPTYVHRVDRLPLTENGKVDKQALVTLAGTLGHGGAHTAPEGPLERRLAMAWAEVLGVPLQRIGREDSFFALGGTSLAAVRLLVHLDRALALGDLVAHPVLAELAAVLEGARGAGERRLLHPLVPVRSPHHRLVCFPYAGGSAVNFRALAGELAREGIEVLAAELPGHDFAGTAGRLQDVPALAARACAEIRELPYVPVLLWGHCAGTALAVETARLLEKEGRAAERVFLGAHALAGAEDLRGESAELTRTSRRTVLGRLRAGRAYIELDALKPERAEAVDRAYRHDVLTANLHLIGVREDAAAHRLRTPVEVVVARDDPATAHPGSPYLGWEAVSCHLALHELEGGGHYFVGTRPARTAAIVRASCGPAAAPASQARQAAGPVAAGRSGIGGGAR